MSDFEKWLEENYPIAGLDMCEKEGDRYTHKPTRNMHDAYLAGQQTKEAAIQEMDEVIKLQDADLRKYEKQIESLRAQLNNMEACYIEKKKECEKLQTENTELQEVVLRDSALATKAQLERNEWQEVVKSQQKTIENLSVRHEVLNIQVDPAHQLKLTEKVGKEISRGSRLTKHRIDLRGLND